MRGPDARRSSARPIGPVLAPADLSVWRDASDALAAARNQADAIVAQARLEASAIAAAAHGDGFRAGSAEAATLVAETLARQRSLLQQLEAEVPRVVLAAVERMIGAIDPGEALTRAVRHGLETLRRTGTARLRVSPGDSVVARDAVAGFRAEDGVVVVVPDPGLAAGVAVLETEFGFVELGLEAQIGALRAALGAEP